MKTETKNCQNCKTDFTIEPEDFQFYEKIKVPPPTFCPECRLIRRLTFRNERSLYKRKCDLCDKASIMMYPENVPFPVYCYECWWSDKWDPHEYGREYDFSKPFFVQFQELLHVVPRPGIVKQGFSVNSEYTNRVTDQKNCYLVFGTTDAEDSRYGAFLNNSKSCMDCYNTQKSERCYECVDCFQCNNLAFSEECNNCSSSWFLSNCTNCQDCFGCVNLRNKNYCIFNKQYTKEEYQKRVAEYTTGNRLMLDGARKKFEELKKQMIVPALVSHLGTNVSGNWIESCKNLHHGFSCRDVEEGKYCLALNQAKDVMDYTHWGRVAELMYEAVSCGMQVSNIRFGSECWNQAINAEYVMNCHNSHDLFGCIGLRNAKYFIFNKQYAENEYKEFVEKIKKHMNEIPYVDKKGRKYGYGEFYPIEISPHAYNETLAHEFFPLTKEKIESQGFPWREPIEKKYQVTLKASDVPEGISSTTDTILKEVIECAHEGKCADQCTKAFRIIPEELEMYRAAKIPLPTLCPNCRHFDRLKHRNPLKLWPRTCQCAGVASDGGEYSNSVDHSHGNNHCPNEFETSYAPERSEIVYCKQCYDTEVV
jgi:hypothetical protein